MLSPIGLSNRKPLLLSVSESGGSMSPEDYMLEKIHAKPVSPDVFGYFMDHAYFSSARLYREIENSLGPNAVTEKHVDALTAILLHNSLYKFAVSFYKDENAKQPLRMEAHPLAWMLMLCDELQCWDRIAYGRNSRTELHPMAVAFGAESTSRSAAHAQTGKNVRRASDLQGGLRKKEEFTMETDNRDIISEVEEALDKYVRPYLAAHGGDLTVAGVEGGVVFFHLTGRCAGCAAADKTSEELINRELVEHVPGIKKAVLANGISPELLEQTLALLRAHPSF